MAIISFECKSRYQLFLLACPICFMLRELCFKKITPEEKQISMLFPLLIHISELLSFIPALINRNNSKKKKLNSQDSSSKSYLYSANTNGEIFPSRKKLIIIVIISSLLQAIYVTAFCWIKICHPSIEQIPKILTFIFIILFSLLLLQNSFPLYKIILTVFIYVGLAFLIGGNFEHVKNMCEKIFFIFLFVISIFVFSLKQIMDKLLMDKYFISPYFLVFLQGSLGLIFTIVISIFDPLKTHQEELNCCQEKTLGDISDIFDALQNDNYWLFILLGIIATFGYNICLMCLKKNYPPSHRILVDCICSTWLWIIQEDKNVQKDVFIFVGYFIIFVAGLFYNELIVIPCCIGTRKEMEKRSQTEYSEATGGLLIQVERREESGEGILIN